MVSEVPLRRKKRIVKAQRFGATNSPEQGALFRTGVLLPGTLTWCGVEQVRLLLQYRPFLECKL